MPRRRVTITREFIVSTSCLSWNTSNRTTASSCRAAYPHPPCSIRFVGMVRLTLCCYLESTQTRLIDDVKALPSDFISFLQLTNILACANRQIPSDTLVGVSACAECVADLSVAISSKEGRGRSEFCGAGKERVHSSAAPDPSATESRERGTCKERRTAAGRRDCKSSGKTCSFQASVRWSDRRMVVASLLTNTQ